MLLFAALIFALSAYKYIGRNEFTIKQSFG